MSQIEGYEKGMLKRFTPMRSCGGCYESRFGCPHCDGFHSDQFPTGAYLPHSCDEWVIGGPEQIRALIADLQAALESEVIE